jgi:hypothetical protein
MALPITQQHYMQSSAKVDSLNTLGTRDVSAAQVLAERAAWDYAKQHQLDLVVINPVGPVALSAGMPPLSVHCLCTLVAEHAELLTSGIRARASTVGDSDGSSCPNICGETVSLPQACTAEQGSPV